jgi:hypothetical protein
VLVDGEGDSGPALVALADLLVGADAILPGNSRTSI